MSLQEKEENTCRVHVSRAEMSHSQMVYIYFAEGTLQIAVVQFQKDLTLVIMLLLT